MELRGVVSSPLRQRLHHDDADQTPPYAPIAGTALPNVLAPVTT